MLGKAHSVDSTAKDTVPQRYPPQQGANTMRHQPTVFEEMLKPISWSDFDRLVERHDADRRMRGFDSRDHLIAMLGAAFGGLNGLRQTVAGLAPASGPLHLLGRKPPARSTLADANKTRPAELFFDLLQGLLNGLQRGLRRDLGQAVRLIDSTQINPGRRMLSWLGLHREEVSAKIHVVYDPRADQPVYFALTPARINDITAAKEQLPIEPGATYVFDLGYYDFAWWAALRDAGCRIVTRLKTNTPVAYIDSRPVSPGDKILSDRTGRLPARMAASRRNPFADVVREIIITISTGKKLRLFTNDLTSPAEEIADLYKERWKIELFFKWVKQNLRIARLMGTSENAVRIQIATALIAYTLIRLAHLKNAIKQPFAILFTVLRGQLFTRKPIVWLLNPIQITRPPHIPQLNLFPSKYRAGQ